MTMQGSNGKAFKDNPSSHPENGNRSGWEGVQEKLFWTTTMAVPEGNLDIAVTETIRDYEKREKCWKVAIQK